MESHIRAAQQGRFGGTLFLLCLSLFFIWGFATVLIDLLVPKLKALFTLNYAEATLTQFAFFLGYLIFSLPAGAMVRRIGYMRGIVVGLSVMAAGCLLFIPATRYGVYPGFLGALFVMAGGVTTLQVAANAVIALAGPAKTSSARLTLAQAFNSLGTTVGPLVGSLLILGGRLTEPGNLASMTPEQLKAQRIAEADAVALPFLAIAAILGVLIVVFIAKRRLVPVAHLVEEQAAGNWRELLGNRQLMFGVIAIFTYVGAEVSIGSLLVNYLMDPHTVAAQAQVAGQMLSFYWGGAMLGRFLGSWILARLRPGSVLACHALAAAVLAATSSMTTGWVAAIAILAVGLANSIMFPTIFTLGLRGLAEQTPRGAALLCMGIVGGALMPLLTGRIADLTSLATALFVPVACYLWIVYFGYFSRVERLQRVG